MKNVQQRCCFCCWEWMYHMRCEEPSNIQLMHTKMFSRDISSPWQQLGVGKALLILHFAFARIFYPFINSLQSRSWYRLMLMWWWYPWTYTSASLSLSLIRVTWHRLSAKTLPSMERTQDINYSNNSSVKQILQSVWDYTTIFMFHVYTRLELLCCVLFFSTFLRYSRTSRYYEYENYL